MRLGSWVAFFVVCNILGVEVFKAAMTLPFEEKTITGSYFGSCVPRVDFPRMLALYLKGELKLEELITRRYRIDEAPQAFADLEAGRNARGVILL